MLPDCRDQRPFSLDEGLTGGPAPIVFPLGVVARPCPLAHALATVLRASLTAFDHSPKPASGRLKGSSPFDGSLRPDERPDAGALYQRQALDQRHSGGQ